MPAAGIMDPLALAAQWLPKNDDPDRPQITLGTLDAAGFPDARTVLLSRFDDQGFYFHTDARTRKARHILANPRVSLTVLWPGFTRQLVIQGVAETSSEEEIAQTFQARSPYLQQLAWQNTHEFAQLSPADRERDWAAFLSERPAGNLEQPEHWTGYLVRPLRLTFWESNKATASLRTEYRRAGGGWQVTSLAG
jgi:pyridoxamine 5'-phosphate oxidase